MARRRRVVTYLFGLSTLGALVSADLGVGYVWAMLVPAGLLSAYIVRLRREERARAAEWARRREMAGGARTRNAEARDRAKARARTQAKTRDEADDATFDRRQAETQAQTQAAARRRSAAAGRARAQSYVAQTQDPATLRRASNG
jgi:hypothetical protein